jgi:hypothetical protein
VSFFGSTGRYGQGRPDRGSVSAYELERRSTRSDVLCAGTLACARCDAPVAVGAEPLSLSAELMCPFCRHRGPAREFLSLAAPTRAAHVVVRVTRPIRHGGTPGG